MEIHKAGILENKLAGIPEIISKLMSSVLAQPSEMLVMEELSYQVT